jgi:hypothetical protein
MGNTMKFMEKIMFLVEIRMISMEIPIMFMEIVTLLTARIIKLMVIVTLCLEKVI